MLGYLHEENRNFVESFTRLSRVVKQRKENQESVHRIYQGDVFTLGDNIDQVDVLIWLQIDFALSIGPAESEDDDDKESDEVYQGYWMIKLG